MKFCCDLGIKTEQVGKKYNKIEKNNERKKVIRIAAWELADNGFAFVCFWM